MLNYTNDYLIVKLDGKRYECWPTCLRHSLWLRHSLSSVLDPPLQSRLIAYACLHLVIIRRVEPRSRIYSHLYTILTGAVLFTPHLSVAVSHFPFDDASCCLRDKVRVFATCVRACVQNERMCAPSWRQIVNEFVPRTSHLRNVLNVRHVWRVYDESTQADWWTH
jgi:hypothetical protein